MIRCHADFHIHSCLSPCGSLEMSPRDIVTQARSEGLSLIAISDHNSACNAPALSDVCGRYDDIQCVFGVEATSVEEVHCLCLFDELHAVLDFGDMIYSSLGAVPNNPDRFGDQVYVDADDNVLGELDTYLGAASSLSLEQLLDCVHERGGLFIPAHVDRAAFSLYSQLGFIPQNDYDALEFSRYYRARVQHGLPVETLINADAYPAVTNSDAHYLDGIGETYLECTLAAYTAEALRDCLSSGMYTAHSCVSV